MLASASASAWHAMEVGQFAIAAPLDSPDARTQYIGIGASGCRSWSVASVASKDLSNKRRLLISRIIPAAQGAHGLLSRHLNTHCSDDHTGAALPRVRCSATSRRTWLTDHGHG